MVKFIVEYVQGRLRFLYGSNHYYTQVYSQQELTYSGHIAEWMEEYLSAKGKTARVMDIGPGYGTLAAVAGKITGGRIVVVDRTLHIIPEVFNEFGLDYLEGDVERQSIYANWPYRLEELDAIILTEVIEHFNFNPLQTLNRLHGMLREGGRMYLSTPDAASWGRVNIYPSLPDIPDYNPECNNYNSPAWYEGHVWQYYEEELLAVMAQVGFKVLRLDYSESVGGRHFNLEVEA